VESLALAVRGPGLVVACKRVRGLRSPGGLTIFRWQRRRSYDLRPFVRVPWAAFGGRSESDRFAASGMVRTPDGTGWLIVDGPNGRVAELSGDGRVVRVSALPRRLLPQTEGITFGVDGTLYLASEGHYGLAVLAAYAPTGERPGP
jgi:sugar lactone lactonase YvrE